MAWLQYKFKENETVFCPYLNKNVVIKYGSYERIWIGKIEEDFAPDFWKNNWEGCGSTLEEVIDSGFPFNYWSIQEAREEQFGYPEYLGKFYFYFYENGKRFVLNKNGSLKLKEVLINSKDYVKGTSFVKKIK